MNPSVLLTSHAAADAAETAPAAISGLRSAAPSKLPDPAATAIAAPSVSLTSRLEPAWSPCPVACSATRPLQAMPTSSGQATCRDIHASANCTLGDERTGTRDAMPVNSQSGDGADRNDRTNRRGSDGSVAASPKPAAGSLQRLPLQERPREKLLAGGAVRLTEAELLAVLLRTGTRQAGVLELARQLLTHFGSLPALFASSREDFCRQPGVGPAAYAQLQAALELARRAAFTELERSDVLSSPGRVRQYLSLQLAHAPHEIFAAIFLDNRHRVICFAPLFSGTIDGAAVYPREVVKRCLSANAAAVIFAHNHPSGVAEPSDADITITRKLVEALALIDVRVLDHIVVGQGVQTSLAERGLM